jgi:hypothetical protein
VAKIAAHSDAEFSLIYTKYTTLEFGQYGIERFYNLAAGAGVGMIIATITKSSMANAKMPLLSTIKWVAFATISTSVLFFSTMPKL